MKWFRFGWQDWWGEILAPLLFNSYVIAMISIGYITLLVKNNQLWAIFKVFFLYACTVQKAEQLNKKKAQWKRRDSQDRMLCLLCMKLCVIARYATPEHSPPVFHQNTSKKYVFWTNVSILLSFTLQGGCSEPEGNMRTYSLMPAIEHLVLDHLPA